MVNDPTSADEVDDMSDLLHRNKRQRGNDLGVISTYVPQWGVFATDSIASWASTPARDVGPDLCRGLILLEDRPTYKKVDAFEACTEMLGLFSMVSFFLLPFSLSDYVPVTDSICFLFQTVPWAATVTNKV